MTRPSMPTTCAVCLITVVHLGTMPPGLERGAKSHVPSMGLNMYEAEVDSGFESSTTLPSTVVARFSELRSRRRGSACLRILRTPSRLRA
jgi:hypothetical protein